MEKRKRAKNFAIISLGFQLTATRKQMNAICLGHVGDLRPLEAVSYTHLDVYKRQPLTPLNILVIHLL